MSAGFLAATAAARQHVLVVAHGADGLQRVGVVGLDLQEAAGDRALARRREDGAELVLITSWKLSPPTLTAWASGPVSKRVVLLASKPVVSMVKLRRLPMKPDTRSPVPAILV